MSILESKVWKCKSFGLKEAIFEVHCFESGLVILHLHYFQNR